jgi:hypothetical protein
MLKSMEDGGFMLLKDFVEIESAKLAAAST